MAEPQGVTRLKEAAALARYLAASRGKLVVLYGKRGCGKTELVRNSLAPLLAEHGPVFFGECSTELPSHFHGPTGETAVDWSAPPAGTIILDDFDRLLALPERQCREAVRVFVTWLRGGSENTGVAVISNESLRDLFALRDSVPEVAENLVELPGLSLPDELERLAGAEPGEAVPSDGALLSALSTDLEQCRRPHVSPELVRAIHAELVAGSSAEKGKPLGLIEYQNNGSLKGLLRRHLARRLQQLREIKDADTARAARAVLNSVAIALAAENAPDFEEIPARLGIPQEAVHTALGWLAEPPALLKTLPDGTLDIRPVQLAEAIQEQVELDQRELAPFHRVLAQGLQAWQGLGTLLPRESFVSLHRARKRLQVNGEQAALMVHCALRYCDTEDLRACRYWIERIPDKPARVVALVRALFAAQSGARARAARLLAGYDEPEVRYQLFRIALEDPDASVRRAAVDSLERLQVEELRVQLEEEAGDPEDPYRQNAVEALRIFHDRRSTTFLQRLVNEPGGDLAIRTAAISTLAAIDAPEAVEALVAIALEDPDPEDREAASAALATIRSEPLQARALEGIRQASLMTVPRGKRLTPAAWLGAGARLLVALSVLGATILLHGLALILLRRPRSAAIFFAVEALGALALWRGGEHLVIVGWFVLFFNLLGALLVSFRAAAAGTRTRFGPAVAKVLLVANFPAFLLFHGLAHLLLKRVRRAFEWFGLEILGVGCFLILVAYPDMFKVTALPQPGILHWVGRNLPRVLGWFYIAGAAGCFAVSFLGDILGAGRLLYRSRHKMEAATRRDRVYRKMIGTPQGASVVLSALRDSDQVRARWARRLVRRFARTIPPGCLLDRLARDGASTPAPVLHAMERTKDEGTLQTLSALWNTAEAPLRSRILEVMARRPSEASLRYFRSLLPQAGAWWRLRYYGSAFLYRIGLWPAPVLLTVTFVLPAAFVLFYEGLATSRNSARPLIKSIHGAIGEMVLRQEPAPAPGTAAPASQDLSEEERHVVEAARFLARRYPETSAPALIEAFEYLQDLPIKPKSESEREALVARLRNMRRALTESLVILAAGYMEPAYNAQQALDKALRRSPDDKLWLENVGMLVQIARFGTERRQLVPGVEQLQGVARNVLSGSAGPLEQALSASSVPKEVVFDALESARTPAAVNALKQFVIAPPAAIAVRDQPRSEQVKRAEEIPRLQSAALRSLRSMGTREAHKALGEIAGSNVSQDLRRQAREHYEGFLNDRVAEARAALERGEYVQALAAEQEVLPDVPESPARSALLLTLGEASHLLASTLPAWAATQREDLAIKYLEQTRQSGPRAVRLLALSRAGKSRLLLDAGNFKGALEQARLGIETDPQCKEAVAAEGSALLQMRDRQGALRAFEKAAEISPGYTWAYYMQAEILSGDKDYAGAEKVALRAVESDPNADWTYSLLQRIYLDQNRLTDLVALLEQLAAKYNQVPYPRQQLAYLYHERVAMTDPKGYQRTYELNKQLRNEVRDPAGKLSADANFIESNLTTGRYDDAARLAQGLYATPEYGIAMRLIGYAALVAKGDYSDAAERLNELEKAVLAQSPDSVATWVFDGTLNYLRKAAIPEPAHSALVKLVTAFNAVSGKSYRELPATLFDQNRAALRSTPARKRSRPAAA